MDNEQIEGFDIEKVQRMVLELNSLRLMSVFKLYEEAMSDLRDESRDVALDSVPKNLQETLEREQCNGAYRAFKRAASFFDELAAELNKTLEEHE